MGHPRYSGAVERFACRPDADGNAFGLDALKRLDLSARVSDAGIRIFLAKAPLCN